MRILTWQIGDAIAIRRSRISYTKLGVCTVDLMRDVAPCDVKWNAFYTKVPL